MNKKFLNKYPNLDRGIIETYLFARQKGYTRDFFPEEYHFLENVSMAAAMGTTIDKEWMARWISKWPPPSVTGLDYSISGNTAACVRNMKRFLKDFNQVFGVDMTLEEQMEIIDRATDEYLEKQEYDDWQYTKKNAKFIMDSNGSVLETYIREEL